MSVGSTTMFGGKQWRNKVWKKDGGFGESVQWLRTPVALVEESDSSTHMAAHKYNSRSRRSNSLFWPPWAQGTCTMYIYMDINTHTHEKLKVKKKTFSKRWNSENLEKMMSLDTNPKLMKISHRKAGWRENCSSGSQENSKLGMEQINECQATKTV